MFAGMLLRAWSIRVLAGFFTVDVTIAADHRLIRSGPFRWVRDPSYTGRLLTVLGFLCALGSWLAPLVVAVPLWRALRRRIRRVPGRVSGLCARDAASAAGPVVTSHRGVVADRRAP